MKRQRFTAYPVGRDPEVVLTYTEDQVFAHYQRRGIQLHGVERGDYRKVERAADEGVMREQDNAIEALTLEHGGSAYVEPLGTGIVRVTLNGHVWLVDEDGGVSSLGTSYGTGASGPAPTANR